MPTLKQLKTIQALPRNGYNLAKSMKEAGYSHNTAYCSPVREKLKESMKKLDILDPECIKKDIKYVYKLARKQKDLTNLSRNIEFRGKIAGMVVEKSEVTNKNPDKIVIAYGNNVNKPVDSPTISTDENVDKL